MIRALNLLITVSILITLAESAFGQSCDCGPDFCHNDPRYPQTLQGKKNAMSAAGYPADLVALMDHDSPCVARVKRAPDGFSIMNVAPTVIR